MADVNGLLTAPLDLLRTALSESTTFQSAVGASSATEALASIYYEISDLDELERVAIRPSAVIAMGDGWQLQPFGTRPSVVGNWVIRLGLFQDVDDDGDNSQAEEYLLFLNFVEQTVADMQTYLDGRGFREVAFFPAVRTPFNQRNQDHDFWAMFTEWSAGIDVE